jgi:predicted nucleotidyltransferase
VELQKAGNSEKTNPEGELVTNLTRHLRSILKKRDDVAAAYLLGSAGRGELRADSDIDIAILPLHEQEISLKARLELSAALELCLNRRVDVGVLTVRNLIYASEAFLRGERLVTLHKNYAEETENRLLGCYFTFRQDRRVVEESYSGC